MPKAFTIPEYPDWRQIEHDILTLEETGLWPGRLVPSWAQTVASICHCHSTASIVTEYGLKEIVRQLKKELDTRSLI